ncbi:DUF4435 domain-containing protein [Pseudomonas sp. JV241A]|uniref:DUF4435 domain-containing protein n=1 Tax=Pseudomonas sp. JV241A TaxID=2078785 RepID=UPI00100C9B28|nr:DUF4435 domain-containing protein [Pseudomonas sp. JV241A]SPO67439.1 conserved protein of unknown function [Pseudomonas sp. JV241A]
MTFTRTNSGRSNLHAFLGVNVVVYTEGGEFDKEKKQSSCSIDAVFWKGFFSRFLPDLTYEIRPLGSKDNLLPHAQDVASSKISNTIVVMDRDHDHHRRCLIEHPCVIYTFGYSWENDAWRAEAVISKLERISVRGVSAETAEAIRSKCRNFFADFNRLIFVDVLCSLQRVQGIHREKFWGFVDARDLNRVKVKREVFKKLILTIKEGRVKKFKYSGGDRVVAERDCYGKLWAKFLYDVFCNCFREVTGQKNLTRDMADVLVAEHFQYTDLNRDTEIRDYYQAKAHTLAQVLS